MTSIAKIGDNVVTSEEFVKSLKLNGKFDCLLDEMLKEKLTVHAAKKRGIALADDEVQERADEFRRQNGLHRATDTASYLANRKITLDEFEDFIRDTLYREKMLEEICSPDATDEFFAMHSPKFDSIEIRHIVVDSEGKAKEIKAMLTEDPSVFGELAREVSIADTAADGGCLGRIRQTRPGIVGHYG